MRDAVTVLDDIHSEIIGDKLAAVTALGFPQAEQGVIDILDRNVILGQQSIVYSPYRHLEPTRARRMLSSEAQVLGWPARTTT